MFTDHDQIKAKRRQLQQTHHENKKQLLQSTADRLRQEQKENTIQYI